MALFTSMSPVEAGNVCGLRPKRTSLVTELKLDVCKRGTDQLKLFLDRENIHFPYRHIRLEVKISLGRSISMVFF